jgi:hypothetical protein
MKKFDLESMKVVWREIGLIVFLGIIMEIYLKFEFSCRFVIPITCFHCIEILGSYCIVTIITIIRIIFDPKALQRFRYRRLEGFVPKFIPSFVCGFLIFTIPHYFILCSIRYIDLSVVIILLPFHFILCSIIDFKRLNTFSLCLLSVGIIGAIRMIEYQKNAIPDFEPFFQLIVAQFSFSIGLIIYKKTLITCDLCLTLVMEMAVALVSGFARLFYEFSWSELIEITRGLPSPFCKNMTILSIVITPLLCFGYALSLNWFDLSMGSISLLLPCIIECLIDHVNHVIPFLSLFFVILGIFFQCRTETWNYSRS